jgi:hypothetical protein
MMTRITLAEWKDYFSVQESGVMNMWSHWNIKKFAPEGNWAAAHEHFEIQGNTKDLELSSAALW